MNARNKGLAITGIIVLVLAGLLIILGGWLAGWDFAAYFRGQAFMWTCILIGAYAIAVAAILIIDKVKSL